VAWRSVFSALKNSALKNSALGTAWNFVPDYLAKGKKNKRIADSPVRRFLPSTVRPPEGPFIWSKVPPRNALALSLICVGEAGVLEWAEAHSPNKLGLRTELFHIRIVDNDALKMVGSRTEPLDVESCRKYHRAIR